MKFFLSLALVLIVAAVTFVRYGIPMLGNDNVPCNYGHVGGFGCSSYFGLFGLIWFPAVFFTIRGIWKRFGEP
ncbi:hypothetical protein HF690_01425 [Oleiagrimonas citrea]|uniref:Transmembrane protein n=1 Tax=Oleiagrimonas citrea TaxID=1665687 RepID=A0A846ZJQ8_9GAMM|nr:hypothetical protein [Oleiagrimonas citrea]NKZ37611.1 hypothetical protein [Oleiagrimonas citrea]